MFFNIGVLKNFANFTRKHQCWSLFVIKLQTFRCFPVNIAKISKRPFFTERHLLSLWSVASKFLVNFEKWKIWYGHSLDSVKVSLHACNFHYDSNYRGIMTNCKYISWTYNSLLFTAIVWAHLSIISHRELSLNYKLSIYSLQKNWPS